MCGERFWKGVVVFCLTLGIGVGLADFFAGEPASQSAVITNAPAAEKKCVPLDQSLKYENLPYTEDLTVTPQPLENKKNEVKKSDKKTPETTAKPQLYVPSKDSAEYRTLLYRERCFETEAQK